MIYKAPLLLNRSLLSATVATEWSEALLKHHKLSNVA